MTPYSWDNDMIYGAYFPPPQQNMLIASDQKSKFIQVCPHLSLHLLTTIHLTSPIYSLIYGLWLLPLT